MSFLSFAYIATIRNTMDRSFYGTTHYSFSGGRAPGI